MNKKKICIISVSLAKGGLERSCANLSILLSDNGYDVHLVTLNNEIDYDYKGQLFNLGLYKTGTDTLPKRLLRFKRLRRFFRQHKFDYIIDNRIGNQLGRELYYMLYIYGLNQKVVYMQHNSRIDLHLPKSSLLTFFLFRYAYAFVGVSKVISQKVNAYSHAEKCRTIYNYAQPVGVDHLAPKIKDYVLYLGRFHDAHKNHKLLLESFSLLEDQSIKLVMMGDGDDLSIVKDSISLYNLSERVIVQPFSPHIYGIIKNAKFLVLTSYYEGFPMTLIESLSVGTPVVAVDCDSGPREIIKHGKNGLLVENHNPKAFSEAMSLMFSDEKLYQKCKSNAQKSIAYLDKDEVVEQWKAILK